MNDRHLEVLDLLTWELHAHGMPGVQEARRQ